MSMSVFSASAVHVEWYAVSSGQQCAARTQDRHGGGRVHQSTHGHTHRTPLLSGNSHKHTHAPFI